MRHPPRKPPTYGTGRWKHDGFTRAAGIGVTCFIETEHEELCDRLWRRSTYGGRKGRRAFRRLSWEVPMTSIVHVGTKEICPPFDGTLGPGITAYRFYNVRGRYRVIWSQMRVCRELRGGIIFECQWREANGLPSYKEMFALQEKVEAVL